MNPNRPSDPSTGRNSPGPRFRFRDRFISRKTFWLPVAMKRDPDFLRLNEILQFDGRYADPSIRPVARDKFNRLRLKYDFTFWAATAFRIPHVDDADRKVPLILNDVQRHITDLFDQANAVDRPLRFIIEKDPAAMQGFHRTGVTTLVNAYICWTQTSRRPGMNSMTVTENTFQSHRLKANFLSLGNHISEGRVEGALPPASRGGVFGSVVSAASERQTSPISSFAPIAKPSRFKIHFPSISSSAHFATVRNPDSPRGIDFALLHLADISAWADPNGSRSQAVTKAAFPSVWRLPQSMIILDGAPSHRNLYFSRFLRSSLLSETNYIPIILSDSLLNRDKSSLIEINRP